MKGWFVFTPESEASGCAFQGFELDKQHIYLILAINDKKIGSYEENWRQSSIVVKRFLHKTGLSYLVVEFLQKTVQPGLSHLHGPRLIGYVAHFDQNHHQLHTQRGKNKNQIADSYTLIVRERQFNHCQPPVLGWAPLKAQSQKKLMNA